MLGCQINKKGKVENLISAKTMVNLNELIYKEDLKSAFQKNISDYNIVFLPKEINGNLAIIVKNKNTAQYGLIIRGSVMELNEAGFHNFILQDFNIFNLKKWDYTDSVKDAFIGDGMQIGFTNLLQLKDSVSNIGLIDFLNTKIPNGASLVISGHSLGGNLATVLASYLKPALKTGLKNNLQIITFGAPAAGNAAFVNDLEHKFPKGERYLIDKDVAGHFPDLKAIQTATQLVGIDSNIALPSLNVNNAIGTVGGLINEGISILDNINIIPKVNKYAQSEKQLRLLKSTSKNKISKNITDLFANAFTYHNIHSYAEMIK